MISIYRLWEPPSSELSLFFFSFFTRSLSDLNTSWCTIPFFFLYYKTRIFINWYSRDSIKGESMRAATWNGKLWSRKKIVRQQSKQVLSIIGKIDVNNYSFRWNSWITNDAFRLVGIILVLWIWGQTWRDVRIA